METAPSRVVLPLFIWMVLVRSCVAADTPLLGSVYREKCEQLRREFRRADRNRDGAVDALERRGNPVSQADFTAMDTNHDGVVDFPEYLRFRGGALVEQLVSTADRTSRGYLVPGDVGLDAEHFREFDLNKDGRLTAAEFKEALLDSTLIRLGFKVAPRPTPAPAPVPATGNGGAVAGGLLALAALGSGLYLWRFRGNPADTPANRARLYIRQNMYPMAVNGLQTALQVEKDPQKRNELQIILTLAFAKRKEIDVALLQLRSANVATAAIEDLYEIALAFEECGRLAEARQLLQYVYSKNVRYRAVMAKLKALETLPAEPKPEEMKPHEPKSPAATSTGSPERGLPAELLSRFKEARVIGQGGMARVYYAEDQELKRPVAIKVLNDETMTRTELTNRFVREGKILAQLHHPGVVRIYAVGGPDPVYLVMEYVEGMTLESLMKQARFDSIRGWDVLGQLADALKAVHERGILHRDLKPANILVSPDGQVHIIDFGISRFEGLDAVTRAGVLMGTLAYMAPELLQTGITSETTDLYSVGATMYEAFTGKRPGEARVPEDPQKLQPLAQVRPDLDPRLARIVMKLAASDPRARYQRSRDLLKDIERDRNS